MSNDPGDEASKSPIWWRSAPGVLGAIAGILTAVGGLLVALHQAGLLGRDRASASPPSQLSQSSSSQPSQHYSEKSTASAAPPGLSDSSGVAAPSNAPSAEIVDRAPRYQVTLPSGSAVTLGNHRGEGTYQILAARVERRSAEQRTLKLSIRLTNAGPADQGFWSDSFRLLVDGVPRAPTSWLNESVEARSAKDADVVFEVPAAEKSLELQITSGRETGSLPLVVGLVAAGKR